MAGPGALDLSFNPVLNGAVYSMAVQPDGRVLIGGTFSTVNGVSRTRIARIFPNGSLDTSFQTNVAGASSTVWTVLRQTDGKILIGGDFTSVNSQSRTRVARLNIDGSLDGTFNPGVGPSSTVYSLAVQSDGKILIGGAFTSVSNTNRNYIARLNADGSLDSTFNTSTGVNGAVNAVAVQADGKVLIGGSFTTVFGLTRNRIARLLTDGSVDQNFQNGLSGASSTVRSMLVQSDGKILLGGDFTTMNNISRGRLARLLTDGTLDTGFNPNATSGFNSSIYSIALQTDGAILVAGDFTSVNQYSRGRIARLYSDGTVDANFLNGPVGANILVRSVALQTDGKPLLGGQFTSVNSSNRTQIAQLYGDLYPPEILTQPISRNTNVSANVTFSVNVNNPTPVNYQWRKDGVNIPGATLNSYTLFNVQTADSGNYSVFLSNGAGGITSSNAVLNVGIAPAITAQPLSLSVTQGQSATFTISASGTPLNYFWKKSGMLIPGQTNNSLTFSNVVGTNAATYTCQVSNFLGNVTSSGAVLTVAFPPTISVQPVGRTVGVTSNFTVSVTATGNPAVTYQWRKDDLTIDGATASSFTVTEAQMNDSGNYDVVVANSFSSVTSSVAAINVIYYLPVITTQPVGGNKLVSSNFTLTAEATGTAPFVWQWFKDGEPLANATTSSYAVTGAQTNDSGSYQVIVTNVAGSATSSVAVVDVGYAPMVLQQPQSETNSVGGTASFSCIVTGSAPMNLQWRYNGTALAGETNDTLTLTNLTPSRIGYYALMATNAFGGTVSSNAALNLAGYDFNLWQGLVAYYPFNGNANDESGNGNDGTPVQAILSSERFGRTNDAYSFDGSSSYISFATVPTTQTNNWTISSWIKPTSLSQLGTVVCVGFDSGLASANGYQTCVNSGNSGSPGNLFAGLYGNVGTYSSGYAFTSTNLWTQIVMLRSNGIASFYVNGAKVGGTVSSNPRIPTAFTIGSSTGIRFFNGLIDDVRIYNRALSSNEVSQLYALEGDVPVITQQPQGLTVAAGGSATFNVTATAQNPLTYQWRKDGINIVGATNSSHTITNAQPQQIGNYSVAVSNAVAGVISSNAALNVTGYNFFEWAGLVAYYPFNGNANDASGNGNNGVVNGAALTEDRFSYPSSGYRFNGSNAYINIGPSINPSNFSLCAWIYIENANSVRAIVSKIQDPLLQYKNFEMRAQPNLSLFAHIPSSTWSGVESQNKLQTSKWIHVVTTHDGSVGRLYINGQKDVNEYIGSYTTSQSAVWIGARPYLNGGPSYFFLGNIDDVRIYNRALSSNEVAQLYALEGDVPVITQQPQGLTVAAGGSATFSISATAQNPLTYQWRKNGANLLGATNAALTLTNVQSAAVGFYSVTVSNAVTGVASPSVLLNLSGFADPIWGGLVAYYPFNGNANDASGNGINLVNQGASLQTDRFGVGGRSYWFDGTGYLASTNVFPIIGNTPRTASIWCYRTNIEVGFLFSWGISTSSSYGNGSRLFINTMGDFNVNGNYSDVASVATNMIVGTGKWLHLVYTYSNSLSDVRIYANGVEIPSYISSGVVSSWNTASTLIYVGYDPYNPTYRWKGYLDDIRIYNRALSSDEVAYLHAQESEDSLLPPQELTANLGAGSNFDLHLTGIPGRNYILQAATNLTVPIQWLPIFTNTADTNGVWQFSETNLNSEQKFFRVTAP